MTREENHSLKGDNTFGIDQKCAEYVVYESEADAVALAGELRDAAGRYLILGGGSNLLLTRDFEGKVVTPARRFDISVLMDYAGREPRLKCWAGTTFDDAVDYAVRHGYYGLENLSLIPGECGASAVQNIGAYGAEAKDAIDEVEAVEVATGRVVRFKGGDCGYAYRQSKFKHEWKDRFLITWVTYRLSRTFLPCLDYGNIRKELGREGIAEERLTAIQLRQVIIGIRQQKLPDPAVVGNAGSFFMNPIVDRTTLERLKSAHPDLRYFEVSPSEVADVKPESTHRSGAGSGYYKIPAGWMIDQCGWKGKSLGRAGVYEKQALVLVNRGGATGADVVRLMHAIQKDVKGKFGIELKPEVNVV